MSGCARSRVVRRVPGEPADSKSMSGQLSRMERSVYKFLYIGPLVQTTSGNASKVVLSSKSDWTLSRRRADIVSAAKKSVFSP